MKSKEQINESRFIKPYKNHEKDNYAFFLSHGLDIVIPDVRFEENSLSLSLCESIYPYFSLSDSCVNWIYNSTLSYVHKIKKPFYSQGFYKYITPIENVIQQPVLHMETKPYIPYLLDILMSNQFCGTDVSVPPYMSELYTYLIHELGIFTNWAPPTGFCLLHGDFKISNIVYLGRPLLVDLEFIRFGPPEVELANFCVQLLGMNKRSDSLMISFFHDLYKRKDCFGDIDYTLVFRLFIPLLMYFRSAYTITDRILDSNDIINRYPPIWKEYKQEFLNEYYY